MSTSAPHVRPPNVRHPMLAETRYRPSWCREQDFIDAAHAGVAEEIGALRGAPDAPESLKLYEMGWYCGEVALEVGMEGAGWGVAGLRGALGGSEQSGGGSAQWYGVSPSAPAAAETIVGASGAGIGERCLVYAGDLAAFRRDLPIVPTMVVLGPVGEGGGEGEEGTYLGVWSDLNLLRAMLAPGTPVLCRGYGASEGVRGAVHEWVKEGTFDLMGRFGGSALLRANTQRCTERVRGLSPERFEQARGALHELSAGIAAGAATAAGGPAAERSARTRGARRELIDPGVRRAGSKVGRWPYADVEARPLARTMPDGRPWPKISVVTPSYNQGRFIEETILSVANQGYPNVEHLVIDGGSTDETPAVLDRHRDRLAYVVSERDGGQSDAINKGFAKATGEILTWLNSDDMLAPGALAAVALAQRASGADVVAGICKLYRDGELVQQHLTSCADGALPLDDLLDLEGCWLAGQFFYQPEVMFTREIWERAGARVEVGAYYSMDYELWLRLAEQGAKLKVIGRPVAWYRVHDEQKTAVASQYQTELPQVRDAFLARTGRQWKPSPARGVKQQLGVVFFNDIGWTYGAGIAHRRIAESFVAAGHRVHAVAASGVTAYEDTPGLSGSDIVAKIAQFNPDLVVVGNMHGAELRPDVLGRISERFPTAFVLHDLWLLSGRCAYPGWCEKYLTGCDAGCTCPPGYPLLPADLVRPAWEAKRRVVWGAHPPALLGDSEWVAGRVVAALDADPHGKDAGRRPAVDWVKYGFELEMFRPRDKRMCRELLELPQDKFIIMSSASSLSDERKGLRHLAEALELLGLPDVLVVCPGWFPPGEAPPIAGMRPMGYVTDPHRLAMLYSAVDLFVGPSLEEAFGQVFVEAAACGTPSVGYPVGGVMEAIRDGVSGRLAARVSADALADAIDELHRDAALRRDLGTWGRIHVENEWSMEAAYHRFSTVMRRHGIADRLGLSRKIEFPVGAGGGGGAGKAPEPGRVISTLPGWRAVSGFGPWEGPHAAEGLPRCRWTLGPVARFEVDAPGNGGQDGGDARLVIACRNFEESQRVRLVQGGRTIDERGVPVTRGRQDHVTAFDVRLSEGANVFELHAWRWSLTAERPMAILITSITSVGVR